MSSENLQSTQLKSDYRAEQEFMQQSLRALASQLKTYRHPGYPGLGSRFRGMQSILLESGHLELSVDDPWNVGQAVPTAEELDDIAELDCRTDNLGRPRHPWARSMAADVAVGVVMGKGFFRRWGPNHTADSIVVQAGHVALIDRKDTGQPALPGGFRNMDDKADLEDSLPAAVRELEEETGFDLSDRASAKVIHHGPVADIRMTANAWPETTAIVFDLGDSSSLPLLDGDDDADHAYWKPLEEARRVQLYGSHNLLLEKAIQHL